MSFAQPLTIQRLATWILFILLFVIAVRVPVDTDTWWHLRSGEATLEDGAILQEDIFSHTRNGEEWVNHSWGAQIFLYGAYKLTGGDGATDDSGVIGLALFTALLALAGMLIIYRMCAGNVYSRMFVLVIGATTAAVFWSARPQMFSFLLSTVILYILYLYKYKKIDRLWWIPLLMVAWVNLHGGFAIGFIFLFGFIAGETVGILLRSGDENLLSWSDLRQIALVTAISILALSLNPYGPRMMIYPFETAGIQVLNAFIQEWGSPDFKQPSTWPFLVLLLSIIVFAGRSAHRVAWSDLALVTGTAFLALWASRNIAVFAVAATPMLSRLLDAWLTERGWQITPTKKISPRMARLNWVLLLLVLIGAFGQVVNTLSDETVDEAQAELLPVKVAAFLNEEQPEGPMFNDYNWGGYFIFTVRDLPVFVDGRTDLYGDEFLIDYFRSILGGEDWREPLEEYDIQLIVINYNGALASLLRQDVASENPEWRIIYEEEDEAIVFERLRGETE
jgi:hypothetical protein